MNRYTGFRDVVNLCRIGPCVTREVTNGTVLLPVLIIEMRNVRCKLSCFDGVSLNIDDRALDSKTVTCVIGHGVVNNGRRGCEDVNCRAVEITTVHPFGVACSRVVGDDVVCNVCTVW